jgi:hypothetical protein
VAVQRFQRRRRGQRPCRQRDRRHARQAYRDHRAADLETLRLQRPRGFVGLPPGSKGVEEHKRNSARALPDKPLELAKLREHDVDIQFRGESVKWGRLPLDNLKTHLVLKDGLLRLAPADFGLAGGHVLLNLAVDVSRDVPRARGELTASNVELKRIFPQLASPRGTAGRVGGRAKFEDARQLRSPT